ncbi:MAG: hypothetical protein AAFR37_09720 [Cyanobacteria bacterium J06628_3]
MSSLSPNVPVALKPLLSLVFTSWSLSIICNNATEAAGLRINPSPVDLRLRTMLSKLSSAKSSEIEKLTVVLVSPGAMYASPSFCSVVV